MLQIKRGKSQITHNVQVFLVDFELDTLRRQPREARILLLLHQIKQLEPRTTTARASERAIFLPVRAAIARAAYQLGVGGAIDLAQGAGPALQVLGVDAVAVIRRGIGGGL